MKNFANFIPAVKALLGLHEFKEKDGKKVLDSDDRAVLAKHGFKEAFIDGFEASLNAPKAEESDAGKQQAVIAAALAQTVAELNSKCGELEKLKSESEAKAKGHSDVLAAKEAEISELKEKVKVLSAMPEETPKLAVSATGKADIYHETQLCGFEGVFFGLDRPYNERAKAAILANHGKMMVANAPSSVDYSTLKEDLGAFYRLPWRERLQSMLVELPTITTIFETESGKQDLETLVNLWLGDFSQADNTESDFDKVVKGSYEFGTETLRMYDVMFVHAFKNLKTLEKSWIGYLNKEGSDPVKMSFIEYLLAETAKKLHNERELRYVNGVRKNPDINVPGHSMAAADGIYEYLRKLVDGHIDYTPDGGTTGKTVYQVKPFELPRITPGNIGEVFYLGTSMVPSVFRDTNSVVLYIPSWMLPLYHKYNQSKYGQNVDYKANINYVAEYPSVRIETIPNADNHCRIFWTIQGNIKTYEGNPGEMLNFKMEQQDWTVKVWSNWKESIQAEAVGKKYTDKAAVDGTTQMIWMNDYDRPDTYFMESERDRNPSVLLHSSVVTVANSSVLEITDIADAQVGKEIVLKCGADGDNGVHISKKDKFALLTADWSPAKGDVIRLVKRADGKFIEVSRHSAEASSYRFAADETEPSVAGATVFVTGSNTKATAIADLQDAVEGVVYTIHGSGKDNCSTIANAGKFVLTAAMTLTEGKMIQLVKSADGKFYEVSRS